MDIMDNEILIGVYDEKLNLVGYKADSFWSLTKKRDCAKIHILKDGAIPPHLISNLRSMLKNKSRSFLGQIQLATKDMHYADFETRLIAYEMDDEKVFTHRVFSDD